MDYKNNNISCLGLVITLISSVISGIAAFNWIEPDGFIAIIIFIIAWGFISKIIHIAIFGIIAYLSS